MSEAVEAVATGAVTLASRDVQLNGVDVRAGKWLGLADGVPVAGGESFDDVAQAVLDRLLAEPRGLLTLLTGDDAPALDGLLSEIARVSPELELEVHAGGQPHYPAAAGGRMSAPVRVVLVEDNDTFRETLELLFGMRDEIEVVAQRRDRRRGGRRCAPRSCPTSC